MFRDLEHMHRRYSAAQSAWKASYNRIRELAAENRPDVDRPTVRRLYQRRAILLAVPPRTFMGSYVSTLNDAGRCLATTIILLVTVVLLVAGVGALALAGGTAAMLVLLAETAIAAMRPYSRRILSADERVQAWYGRRHAPVVERRGQETYAAWVTEHHYLPAIVLLLCVWDGRRLRVTEIERTLMPADSSIAELAEAADNVAQRAEELEDRAHQEQTDRELAKAAATEERRARLSDQTLVQRAISRR
jgi:hypothetical protein